MRARATGTAMFESELSPILIILFFALALLLADEAGWLLGKLIEPFVHLFQRYVLGIRGPRVGTEQLSGREVALDPTAFERGDEGVMGHVMVDGERWRARLEGLDHRAATARIGALDGLILVLVPA